jgi:hypothetical protein
LKSLARNLLNKTQEFHTMQFSLTVIKMDRLSDLGIVHKLKNEIFIITEQLQI